MCPLPISPVGPPQRQMPVSRVLYISFWIPIKGAPPLQFPPNRVPAKRDAPFLEPSNYPSKFPVNGPPTPGSPTRPLRRKRHPFPGPSSSHSPITHLFHKVSGKAAPFHVHPTGSLWREMLPPQSQWFIHTFISVRVPS
jgi:hypothetical protein